MLSLEFVVNVISVQVEQARLEKKIIKYPHDNIMNSKDDLNVKVDSYY